MNRLSLLFSKIWLRVVSPSGMRLLAPLLAIALVVAGWWLWRRVGRTVLGRAVRWWAAAVPAAAFFAIVLYLLSAPPDEPAVVALLDPENARLGRSPLPAPLAAAGAVLFCVAALAAGWTWWTSRLAAEERAELARRCQAGRGTWLRRGAWVAAAGVGVLAAGYAAATAGAPQVPARGTPAGATGALWVGTSAGVSIWDAGSGEPGWDVLLRPSAPLPSNRVTSLAADRGGVWIATHGGLARHAPAIGQGAGRGTWTTATVEQSALPYPTVLGVAVDARGVAWAATGAGVAAVDPGGGAFLFTDQNAPLLHQIMDAAYVDPAGRVWLGGAGGVNVYQPAALDTADGDWIVGFNAFTTGMALPDNLVFTIAGDSKGRIWFGTAAGAAVLTPDTSAATLGAYEPAQWRTFAAGATPLPESHVHAVAEDRQGRIWLGTERGLAVVDEAAPAASPQRWQVFAAGNGQLPDPWVQALAVGPDGRVWVGTRGGLAVYDPQQPDGGWRTYRAQRVRYWAGYLWPRFWRENILADDVTSLVWSR